MNGYTVVDFETTGFSHARGDRVVEIGVVTLDTEGNILDEWETLINPMRHVGATHIHGICAKDVVGAPTFSEVADLFAADLTGNIFVAHNAAFDEAFARGELTACQRLNGSPIPVLDTMAIARRTLSLRSRKLADVCSALGIRNENAHSALSDARATALVLQTFIRRSAMDWHDIAAASRNFDGYTVHDTQHSRDHLRSRRDAAVTQETLSNGEWIDRAIGRRDIPDNWMTAQYFALLDAALLDSYLSTTEQTQLLAFAYDNGLSPAALSRLHAEYVQLVVRGAEADGIVTDAEHAMLRAVSTYLGVDLRQIPKAVDAAREPVHPRSMTISLKPGDRVSITGPVLRAQDSWASYFSARDVQVAGIAKATKVLIAGDPDSQSGKARKARQYGIPIIGESSVDSVLSFD